MKKTIFLVPFLVTAVYLTSCGEKECKHVVVVDTAVEPTFHQIGLTEGSHCEKCGEIFIKQEIIPCEGHAVFAVAGDGGRIIGNLNQVFTPGSAITPVTAIANLGYKFKHWTNGSTEHTLSYVPTQDEAIQAVFESDDNPMPVISIETNEHQPILDKENWITCSVTTTSTNADYCFDSLIAKIKGRGNSTWNMPKHPYKFKLDAKTSLFGFGKAKNWVLLANYADPSSLRNQIAYTSGKLLSEIEEFTPDILPVELVLNGEYQGVYNFTEQVEINKYRVDITKDNPDPDTGFIIELDSRAPEEGVENVDYFVVDDRNYAVKDPDPDDELTPEQMAFIRGYFEQVVSALNGDDYSAITDLIDVNTFVDSYIVHEMVKSVDGWGLSFYFYKDVGGKLCSGPIWDFDISQGNCNYEPSAVLTDYLYAKERHFYYQNLLKFNEFEDLVKSKLNMVYSDLSANIDQQIQNALSHYDSYHRNFDIWQTIGTYVWPNPQEIVDIKTWEGNLEYLSEWTHASLDYMKEYYLGE